MSEIAQRPSAAAVVAKYDQALSFFDGNPIHAVTKTGPLIPRAELPALIEALTAPLVPATKRQLAEAMAMISVAWPHAHQRTDDAVLDQHIRTLAEDLAGFPADILFDVIKDLRRSQRFAPAISEIYGPASDARWKRRRRLQLAQEHQQEHERRDAEAREAADREALWKAEEQQRDLEHVKQLTTTYGAAFADCTLEDIQAASRGFFYLGIQTVNEWWKAGESGEAWVPQTFPLMVLAGRAIELMEKKKLGQAEVSEIICIAASHHDRAAQLIADIAAGAAPSDLLGQDDTAIFDYPSRLLRDLVADIRRAEQEAATQPATGIQTPRARA